MLNNGIADDLPASSAMPSRWVYDSKSPQHSPRPSSAISLLWKQQMIGNVDWISVFDDIVQFISLDRTSTVEQKQLACTSGSWMEPTVYRLLAIRPLRNGSQSEHEMEEICRLGTLLFLAPFWRALGQNPVWTAAISRNLFFLLGRNHVEWGQLNPLLIWILYFAAIETENHVERSHFVSMLSAVLKSMNLE